MSSNAFMPQYNYVSAGGDVALVVGTTGQEPSFEVGYFPSSGILITDCTICVPIGKFSNL
jgi:hypothetical protein